MKFELVINRKGATEYRLFDTLDEARIYCKIMGYDFDKIQIIESNNNE